MRFIIVPGNGGCGRATADCNWSVSSCHTPRMFAATSTETKGWCARQKGLRGVLLRVIRRYGWFDSELKKKGHESICVNFPDPDICHQSNWIPFVRDTLKADEQTVLATTPPPPPPHHLPSPSGCLLHTARLSCAGPRCSHATLRLTNSS